MKQTKPSSVFSRFLELACFCAVVGGGVMSALGADITWNNAEGGAFGEASNWTPSVVPGSADTAMYTNAGDYTVTFDGTFTNSYAMFQRTGGIVTWDVGAGNEYRLMKNIRMYNSAEGTGLKIVSGTVSAYNHVMVGEGTAQGLSLEVSGAGTRLYTVTNDITAGYGTGSCGNEIVVKDGAVLAPNTFLRVGNEAGSDGNRLVVQGEGTRCEMTNAGGLIVGNKGSNNTAIFETGAYVVVDGEKLGNAGFNLGAIAGSAGNELYIRSGAVFSNLVSGANVGSVTSGNKLFVDNGVLFNEANLVVGQNGSNNEVHVSNGGEITVHRHFMQGHRAGSNGNRVVVSGEGSSFRTTNHDINIGAMGHDNSFVVSNGAYASAHRNVHVGYYTGITSTGSYNELLVTGHGSLMECAGLNGTVNSLLIGSAGSNNVVRIEDGGAFRSIENNSAAVDIGKEPGSYGNRLEVSSDGSFLCLAAVFVGSKGACNELVVSNGVFETKNNLVVGYSVESNSNRVTVCDGGSLECIKLLVGNFKTASNNVMRVTGAGSKVVVNKYDIEVGSNGAETEMVIADHASVEYERDLYVGRYNTSSNNLLRVENGTLTGNDASRSVQVRYNSTLEFAGDHSVVSLPKLQLTDSATLSFDFGDNGFTPVEIAGDVTLDATCKIVVDARGCANNGDPITLLNCNRHVIKVLPENITLLPEGTTIDLTTDRKKITVKVPFTGTVLLLR